MFCLFLIKKKEFKKNNIIYFGKLILNFFYMFEYVIVYSVNFCLF